MAKKDTQYLQQLGHSWYVRVKVPRAAQAVIGNTHLRKALGTRDLDVANERKWAYVALFKKQIQQALRGPVPAGIANPLVEDAKKWREGILEARAKGDDDQVEIIEDQAVDVARELEEKVGEQQAVEWFQLATAKTPTLGELFDKWQEGENYKPSTKKQDRKALSDLEAYLGGDKLPAAVTANLATDFVEDWLKKSGQAYNTQRRKINSLVKFWKWLGLRRYVERGFNPWTGFILSKSRTPKRTPDKRAYKDEELLRLFAAPPQYEGLADVMVLGLYTGARIEELCALRMKDVERKLGAYFVTLKTGKGKTKTRVIAITHDAPSTVLERRWSRAGSPDSQLFPSFKPGGYDGKLSWAVSKAFGRLRDAAGLPRAVDFHSFRRTLMTTLENLGVDQAATARYVGHTLPTLAFTVYSGGSSEKTNREVARQIKYPPKIERAVEAFLKRLGGRAAKAA